MTNNAFASPRATKVVALGIFLTCLTPECVTDHRFAVRMSARVFFYLSPVRVCKARHVEHSRPAALMYRRNHDPQNRNLRYYSARR